MTFKPPRIGPISGVLTAPNVTVNNYNVIDSGLNTSYNNFPNLGDPPPTGVQTCPEFVVPWNAGGGGTGYVIIPPGGYGSYDSTDVTTTLYGGATYRVDYTVFHTGYISGGRCYGSNQILVNMQPTSGPGTSYGSAFMGSKCQEPPPVACSTAYRNFASVPFTPGSNLQFTLRISAQFYFYCDSGGTWARAQVVYVSGPDPRYSSLPPCDHPIFTDGGV